jgi:HAD superfamily hydrolase (TIGR01484 family)
MKAISLLTAETARLIQWVLTDIDDTMTCGGILVPEAYATLCALKSAGLRVVAVTGRSSGWGEVHLQEWPIDAAITENGAICWFRDRSPAGEYQTGNLVHPSAVRNTAPAIARAAASAFRAVPRARAAGDNHLRLYDFAIDHAERVQPPLTENEVAEIVGIFEQEGCMAKPSSIHINTWIGSFNKREAALMYLKEQEGYTDETDREKVLYIGDALNDEVMFEYFPNACAVANIDIWLDRLVHTPAWISMGRFGAGFAEIGQKLLKMRL